MKTTKQPHFNCERRKERTIRGKQKSVRISLSKQHTHRFFDSHYHGLDLSVCVCKWCSNWISELRLVCVSVSLLFFYFFFLFSIQIHLTKWNTMLKLCTLALSKVLIGFVVCIGVRILDFGQFRLKIVDWVGCDLLVWQFSFRVPSLPSPKIYQTNSWAAIIAEFH